MKHLFYRIGKKVGVIAFDVKKNRDYVKYGRVIARKYAFYTKDDNKTDIYARYAVLFEDGTIEVCDHESLWSARRIKWVEN